MGHSCQCGDECPLCTECDAPKCECYCDFYEGDDEEEDEYGDDDDEGYGDDDDDEDEF